MCHLPLLVETKKSVFWPLSHEKSILTLEHDVSLCLQAAQQRKVRGPAAPGGGGRGGAGANILQFYSDDSPGLQIGPTTVLVASLSFVGIVVLLHIIGKFRS